MKYLNVLTQLGYRKAFGKSKKVKKVKRTTWDCFVLHRKICHTSHVFMCMAIHVHQRTF